MVASLALLTGLAAAMVVARIVYTGESTYANLIWNLILAWIPLLLALFLYDAARRGAGSWLLLSVGIAWLLFFPNAPYLMTDFQLLRDWTEAPIWYDVVLLSTAAWTGLTLGFASLYLVHVVVRRRLGALTVWAGVAEPPRA